MRVGSEMKKLVCWDLRRKEVEKPNVFVYSSTSSSSTDEVEQTEDYVDLDDVSESLWSE